ncbi:MAG TPA: hypothetical protein VFH51_03010, partial [Myxococcota bacterium]|nr:hypothetical protein [Myxococcota bacterium]
MNWRPPPPWPLLVVLSLATCHRPPATGACPTGTHPLQTARERVCVRDNGVREGPGERFFEDGRVRERGAWRDNKRNGAWQFFREDGQLLQEGEWRDGGVLSLRPAGLTCPAGTQLNGDPPPKGRAVWCQALMPEHRWRNEGPFMSWHDDGQPQGLGAFSQGKPDGEFTMWYPDGALKVRGAYTRGKE